MTRPLRQRHRIAFLALAFLLPVAFTIAIAARKPLPVVGALPAALQAPAPVYEDIGSPRTNLFAKTPLQVRILKRIDHSGRIAVGLSSSQSLIEPDLIVYWNPGGSLTADTLPDTAILLGTFGPAALDLPDQAARSPGVLVLYSLADGEIVDTSKPILLPPPNERRGNQP